MNKYTVLAAIALTALAANTEAKFSIKKITKPIKKGLNIYNKAHEAGLFEEEEGVTIHGGISGSGGRPTWTIGGSASWEEEQALKVQIKKAAQVLIKAQDIGLLSDEVVEEQGLGKTLKKAAKVLVKASEAGLLDDSEVLEEEQKFKLGKALKKIGKVALTAQQLGLLDEEELDEESKIHWNKVGHSISKGLDLYGKAKDVGLFDEEEQKVDMSKILNGVDRGLDLYGKAKQVGLLDEEQKLKLKKIIKTATTGVKIAGAVGLLEEDEEEQKFKIKKIVKAATTGIKIAGAVGLLEEDELEQGLKIKSIKKGLKVAVAAGLLEEEEAQKVDFSKIANGVDRGLDLFGKAKQVGLFEEEEEEQKLKLKKIVKAATTGVKIAGAVGLLEEEEEQKLKLKKVISGAVKVAQVAGAVGLLEEGAELTQEQKFSVKKTLKKAAKVANAANQLGLLSDEEYAEQKFDLNKAANALDRGLDLYGKAKQVGLFDEEEWTVNAGISSDRSFNASISHSWDEEEQKFKLGKALKKAGSVLNKANDLGLLEEDIGIPFEWRRRQMGSSIFEDEEEEQKIKLHKVKKIVSRVADIAKRAQDAGLLE